MAWFTKTRTLIGSATTEKPSRVPEGLRARLDRARLPFIPVLTDPKRNELLVEHGMLDLVIDRRALTATVARALRFMGAGSPPTGTTAAIPASLTAAAFSQSR